MAESLIKWKRGDYAKLGRAISKFNKKRNELINEENKLYFPKEIDYKEAKANITTRREFNRYVAMIKRFQEEDATVLYTNEVGEEMTEWTHNELKRLATTVKQRASRKIKELNKPLPGQNYSLAQMGHGDIKIEEWKIRKAEQLEMKKGKEFEELKSFISFQGSSDVYTKRAIVYQKNYMEVLERYQNYDNYDILMKELKKIKNPNLFYEVMSNTELAEIDKDLYRQSDEVLFQWEFDSYVHRVLKSLNIQIELEDSGEVFN